MKVLKIKECRTSLASGLYNSQWVGLWVGGRWVGGFNKTQPFALNVALVETFKSNFMLFKLP